MILLAAALALSGVPERLRQEALTQAEKPSGYWARSARDCAGFVRFLYRTAAGVRFRDRHGELVDYLAADELIAFNFERVARRIDRTEVRTGDVLAFYSPHKKPSESWHLMVILTPPPGATDRLLAVYHNGDTGAHAQVRKVWVDDLLDDSAPQWRPRPENRRFLGVFRWKGWEKKK